MVRHQARLPFQAHWELVPQVYMVPEDVVLTAWASAVRAVSQVVWAVSQVVRAVSQAVQALAFVVVRAVGY